MEKIPFFIIGSGRSGSTYLYHLLKVHSKIALTNEAKVLDALGFSYEYCNLPNNQSSKNHNIRGVVSYNAIPVLSQLFEKYAKKILEEFYLNYFPNQNFIRWGDKLPNAAYAIAIKKLFPKVYYLVIVRDPRDVLCSYRSYYKPLEEKFPQISQIWCKTYKYILSNLDETEYYLIYYEDLIKSPTKIVKEVLSFLNLEIESDVIESIRTNNTFEGHGTSPSISESIGRWQKELTDSELEVIEGECSSLMKTFNYQ